MIEELFMNFNDATIKFHSSMTAACSQFEIHSEGAVSMTVSGPSRYTYLKLNTEETLSINALAKEVGINHERGHERNTFMVYSGTFCPSQVKVGDILCEATSEEKRIFGEIFDIASSSIATQMGWSVSFDDITEITLEKTVDFSFIEAHRACRLSIQLSQSAADRLGMNEDGRFREYDKGPHSGIAMIVNPGQF